MTDAQEVWWRPGGRSPFALDPSKPRWPQFVSTIGQCSIIFGGPALGLVTINYYPFLIQGRTIYIGGFTSVIFWFFASFAIFGDKSFPRGMPQWLKLKFRAAYGLCMTGLLLGIVGIANAYNTPLISRDVAVVAKHTTRHSDPARRTYYVALRPWPSSQTVVELCASRDVYDRLKVPLTAIDTPQRELDGMPDSDLVRLTVGKGRLKLEWLKQISLPEGRG
ncbi:MAG TPA: hypothetical protein VKG24_09205 [Pseudolabrys sp.]|nr:hypothetical protein [Pseudolabrys sp.]